MMQLRRLATGCMASMAAFAVAISAQTAGDLSVLTINVAGLPQILQGNDVPGDKATNSRMIGSLLTEYGYDIVNMQEVCDNNSDRPRPCPSVPVAAEQMLSVS
jgi:hypothetical protein